MNTLVTVSLPVFLSAFGGTVLAMYVWKTLFGEESEEGNLELSISIEKEEENS